MKLTEPNVMKRVVILNLGWGNLDSLRMFFKRCGYRADIIDLATDIEYPTADILVIPGVGSASAFAGLCSTLRYRLDIMLQKANKIVGICLGMHVLFNYLEEGNCKGLGIIDKDVIKHCFSGVFSNNIGYRWVDFRDQSIQLYFCHSYGVLFSDVNTMMDEVYTFTYPDGNESQYLAGFKSNILIGLQFHPEKSGDEGLRLMKKLLDE